MHKVRFSVVDHFCIYVYEYSVREVCCWRRSAVCLLITSAHMPSFADSAVCVCVCVCVGGGGGNEKQGNSASLT